MSVYICPYTCSYRTNGGYCGKTGGYESCQYIKHLEELEKEKTRVVRCWECLYRRRCMLQHFVLSNAVDGRKIDGSEWYCADGVRDDKADASNK